ncbi:hypothetical protein M427DRAFT_50909 [Gonapodya prolifera JEL478]|uniref:Uncharacterized protein n=1 Tax=Gonapodya prolifera (strain JEL478) TaxID=1344416 RepID=A0A139AXJ8_GONPJ|nr:hypothetical protein M427DRAFT_50909 [Gonapodya prolifera JEL478]|eukprot:KXS21472.1 hypothetical protein M427DRAFT_50909 [Gonapodya prolifera JEL478]
MPTPKKASEKQNKDQKGSEDDRLYTKGPDTVDTTDTNPKAGKEDPGTSLSGGASGLGAARGGDEGAAEAPIEKGEVEELGVGKGAGGFREK